MGQDNFYFSQYFQVGPAINPAITGIDNFLDIKINYRDQWNGFTDAPTTNYLGINGYLQKENPQSYKQYSLRTSNPSYLDELIEEEIPMKERARHGIGGYIVYDVQGPYEQISGFANYALHLPLNKKLKLSIGVSGSISNHRLDLEKIKLKDPTNDDFYQALLTQGGKSTFFDVNPGVMLYSDTYYISYAAFHVIRKSISSDEFIDLDGNIDHSIMAGVKFPLNNKLEIMPSLLFNYNSQYKNTWDANLKALIKQRTWAGLTYRSTKALVFMGGVYLNNKFNLSYSYDHQLSNINQYTSGSHEITIGLMLYKKDLKAPYLW